MKKRVTWNGKEFEVNLFKVQSQDRAFETEEFGEAPDDANNFWDDDLFAAGFEILSHGGDPGSDRETYWMAEDTAGRIWIGSESIPGDKFLVLDPVEDEH